MIDAGEQRTFSREKHASGHWTTRTPPLARNPAVRAIVNFYSFKRHGVDRLAHRCAGAKIAMDLGAGVGAYARWFAALRKDCLVIAVDWSPEALRVARAGGGRIAAVCADAHLLPFKALAIDCAWSIDTLGHVADQDRVLDEISRVLKGDASLFLHSECGNYRQRWPDRMLIRKLGCDMPAQIDGHVSVCPSAEIRTRYLRRFRIVSFFSPAGIGGWLLGYPEKYRDAFKKARCRTLFVLTCIFACIKRLPVAGAVLRSVNILTNRLELSLGIEGGGSCFAELRNPARTGS